MLHNGKKSKESKKLNDCLFRKRNNNININFEKLKVITKQRQKEKKIIQYGKNQTNQVTNSL